MKWHQKESGSLLKEKSRYKHTHTHTLSSVRLHTHTHTYTHTLSSTPQWEPGRVWLLHLLESHLLQWRWPGCSIYVEWFVLRQNENSLKRKKIPKEMKKKKSDCSWPVRPAHMISPGGLTQSPLFSQHGPARRWCDYRCEKWADDPGCGRLHDNPSCQ